MNTSTQGDWHGRWALAPLVACAGYMAAYMLDVTPVYYYPMVGEWHVSVQGSELGPRITYFGWKIVGLLCGGIAMGLPQRWSRWLTPGRFLVAALAMVAVVALHEIHWFFK